MGRLVRDDRKATVTQITTRYNQGMQNTISEHTTCRTLKQMCLQQQRPHRILLLSAKKGKGGYNSQLEKTLPGLMSLNFCCDIQIKSNHFYCHITTAQVPWWVKFLWACSRQCKKTTDNLPMDRQCKKTTNNLHMDRQCKKTALEHLQCSRQCKKKQQQFTYGQTVQKKQQQFTYGQTVQKTTAIYIWTVHIYRLYRRQCAKYTYIYSVHLVYYRDILNYQRHIIHRMGTSTLCTVSIHNVVYT